MTFAMRNIRTLD